MSTLAERIKKAMDSKGISQSELARAVGIKPPSVSGWLSGTTKSLRAETANLAAKALGVDPVWLITGVGDEKPKEKDQLPALASPGEEAIALEKLDLWGSCGAGATGSDYPEVEKILVNPLWFRENISRSRANSFKLITGHGDSMEPTIKDGATLVIDTTETDIRKRDGIYFFQYDGMNYIKRLQLTPGSVLAISDNPRYEKFTIPLDDIATVQVFGRVVASFAIEKH